MKPYKWMLDVTWLNICELKKIDFFKDLLSEVILHFTNIVCLSS